MRRWDRLQDTYIEQYRGRGLSEQTALCTESRLDRWGRWLKKRCPRVAIERIDVETITRCIEACASFRSKATVYGTLSTMRGFGDYLVHQGLWKINPLRWMKGPKVTPYSRLPKRIDHAHMEALWRAAANRGGDYSSHLWVTVLAMLYGTGLRRGELARFDCRGVRPQRRRSPHRWPESPGKSDRSAMCAGCSSYAWRSGQKPQRPRIYGR